MKFKIEKEIEEEKISKLIKFPKSLALEIEKYISKNDVSYTKFVIEACIYALDNMENE